MLDPKQKATMIIEQYRNTSPGGLLLIEPKLAKSYALIDVQNTIDALEKVLEYEINYNVVNQIEFYNQVKEHIKQL